MQKHLFKSLIEFIGAELLTKFPNSKLCPAKDQPKVQAKLFSLGAVEGFSTFVMIQGRNIDESFTAEIGISRRGRFPWKADVDFDESTGDAIADRPLRCRLGFLMPPYKDAWYPATSVSDPELDASEEELLAFLLQDENAENFPGDLIETNGRKVIRGLHKHGLPFLQRCAEK